MKTDRKSEAALLRKKAEGMLGTSATLSERPETDMIKLVHELQVHQIELELQNEELILAKEKAEESNRLKSAFLANMSHEIRTPMNGILGFADQLKEPGLTGEETQKYIGIIEKSGVRMLNIINNIVDISKIESGQMEVFIAETNINEQIEYLYAFFKPEADSKGIEFSFSKLLPAKEAIIRTDREKLNAILANLIKNAIKFTDAGSIEFGYVVKPDKPALLEFFVRDSGIGIARGNLEAIFDRFVQMDSIDTRALQGAGLGLAISKSHVEMLGGNIRVESEPGKGSVFYFTHPYQPESANKIVDNEIVADENANSWTHKLKVLIVEDDETADLLLTLAVKKISREVLHAKTGIETIHSCRKHPDIDLILMDIKMPEMDGYEATRQIRQFNPEVVIIAQTAYGFTGDRERAIEAGCNDYLPKPLNQAVLIELIKRNLKEKNRI